MITAIPETINKISSNQTRVTGVFRDDVLGNKIPFETIITGNVTDEQVRKQLENLYNSSFGNDIEKILSIGTPFDLTPPPVIPPTQDELDRREYFRQAGLLTQLALTYGIAHKNYTDKLPIVEALFKSTYYD